MLSVISSSLLKSSTRMRSSILLFFIVGVSLLTLTNMASNADNISVLSTMNIQDSDVSFISNTDDNLDQKISLLEIPFLQNIGQFENESVKYYVDTFAGRVFVTNENITYVLNDNDGSSYVIREFAYDDGVAISFQDVIGMQKSSTNVSSFIGNDPEMWKSDIPTYDGLSLGKTWDGIDMSLHAYGNNIEKIFTVMPGYDSSDIQLSFDGISKIQTDADNNLILYSETDSDDAHSVISIKYPIAYQIINGEEISVDVKYNILDDKTYGFTVGMYDDKYPLVIDPSIQSTYIGGSGKDEFVEMIVADNGEVFAAAQTTSTDFPGTAGSAQTVFATGSNDLIIFKLDSDLTTLIQSTYLGGSNSEMTSGLDLDSSGNLFVEGKTASTDFPGITGGAQTVNAGNYDLFVSKLSNDLTTIIQSTYLGTSVSDINGAMMIDSSDNVFVTGSTLSSTDFPGTTGGAQTVNAGNYDLFVSKLSNDLTTIIQSTYIGGTADDIIRGIGVDSSDNVFVTGRTASTDFPGITGGAQTVNAGNYDLFVSKLSNDLTTIIQSTYIGGTGLDDIIPGYTITFDNLDNLYIGGDTISTDFSGTTGGAQASHAGGALDAFVLKLSNNLTTLIQSTYLGGTDEDQEVSAVVLLDNAAYVLWETQSDDILGVDNSSMQPTRSGGRDLVISKLDSDLTTLIYSTYLGGSLHEYAYDLQNDGFGNLIIASESDSPNFPGTTGGAQATNAGSIDVVLTKYIIPAASKGSGDCVNCTEPTLGVDKRGVKMVDNGFTFNGKNTDVEYYFTPFELITVNVGKNNLAEFKIYDDGGPDNIEHFEFAYGMSKGQHMSQSNVRIEYDIDDEGAGTITIIDPENVIDHDSVMVETDTVSCMSNSLYDCLLVQVSHTFRAPLKFDIIGTNVWDVHHNSVQNYYNHGISVEGNSLNLPKEITIASIPKIYPDKTSLLELSEIDLLNDLWIDKLGYVWQGDESKMNLISEIPFTIHQDSESKYSGYSDRNASEFSNAIMTQQILAQEQLNSLYPKLNNDNFDNELDGDTIHIVPEQMYLELSMLEKEYKLLQGQYDAQLFVESQYPYLLENNFGDSAYFDDYTKIEKSLHEIKEQIFVINILINWHNAEALQ